MLAIVFIIFVFLFSFLHFAHCISFRDTTQFHKVVIEYLMSIVIFTFYDTINAHWKRVCVKFHKTIFFMWVLEAEGDLK